MNTHYLGTSIYTSVVYGFRILVSPTSVGKPTRSMDANAEILLHYNTQKPCKGIEAGTTLLLVSLVYVQSIAPYSSKRLTVQIGTLSHSETVNYRSRTTIRNTPLKPLKKLQAYTKCHTVLHMQQILGVSGLCPRPLSS